MDRLQADVCVIGAGSGGLSVAAGASMMGAKTVLFEGHKMGGDCLNFGCVPSKAMIAAGDVAETVRRGEAFGMRKLWPDMDFGRVQDHVARVITAIAPNDSVQRFEGLGVKVIEAKARFAGPREVEGGGIRVDAKWIVVATGSSALVPPIPGLAETPYFTNETIFDNRDKPEHLIVVGGGPIGIELAQAHRRLGAKVTVVELARLLPKDDDEAVDVVRTALLKEGLTLRENTKVVGVAKQGGGVAVTVENQAGRETIAGSHLLLAVGRKANVAGLDLEKAGIAHSPKGIAVDARLRTTNSRVFAIGDVAGGLQFTHVAGYHAGVAIKNMLFRIPAKAATGTLPWVTYSDPELAHVGLSEHEARARGQAVRILRWPFHENDRAQAERATHGFVKIVAGPRGQVLGATIVGRHAGELIQTWVLAMNAGLKVSAVAQAVAPYPTLAEASKRAAGAFFMPALFSERTKKIVRFLMRFA